MTRSTDFDATVKRGIRAAQPDLVVHARLRSFAPGDVTPGPRIGFVVAKSVGSAVQRHAVARRLRHVSRTLLEEMDESTDLVVRALPSSRNAASSTLAVQMRCGLHRVRKAWGASTGSTP